jgi:hypothetical protein
MEFPLGDERRENPNATLFEEYHARHPEYLRLLIDEALAFLREFGRWSIQGVREMVMMRHGKGPHRTFLPAYTRKMMSECPALRNGCKTRSSKFGE